MAANLSTGGRVLAGSLRNAGRSLSGGLRDPAAAVYAPGARSARPLHASSYDKNPDDDDDQALPSAVPDDILKPKSTKYWGPNPTTGVFGPADKNGGAAATGRKLGTAGVLDQAPWFRPLEDVQKPPPS